MAGEGNVAVDHKTRVLHATGKAYRDLVALRSGRVNRAPDAVVFPEDEATVAAVLAYANDHDLVVVPFGGGTSVVGGVEPPEGERAVLTLDLRRMGRILAVDTVSLTVTAEAGIRGPLLEEALRVEGYTVGHVPQSFEFSTLGGWAATRSTGALSNRYGKFEDLVVSLRLVHPGGVLDTKAVPASAAGPSLKDLVLGSEGVLGVITQVTVRMRPLPAARRYASYLFPSFSDGVDALRRMAQAGAVPAMTYLSDEAETEMAAARGPPPLGTWAGVLARLARRRGALGSLLAVAYEGTVEETKAQRRNARAACQGTTFLGAHPARTLAAERFELPYLRDSFLDHGVMVDTVETAIPWSRLMTLYHGARDALQKAIWQDGVNGLVLCHVSHVYRDGASLYFTFLAPQKAGDEIGQWRRIKTAVTDAIVAHGGTVSHHHGVGVDHRPWVAAEWGDSGVLALRSLKERLDPKDIMNPGKLLPPMG